MNNTIDSIICWISCCLYWSSKSICFLCNWKYSLPNPSQYHNCFIDQSCWYSLAKSRRQWRHRGNRCGSWLFVRCYQRVFHHKIQRLKCSIQLSGVFRWSNWTWCVPKSAPRYSCRNDLLFRLDWIWWRTIHCSPFLWSSPVGGSITI